MRDGTKGKPLGEAPARLVPGRIRAVNGPFASDGQAIAGRWTLESIGKQADSSCWNQEIGRPKANTRLMVFSAINQIHS